jgi:hypothetical protein
MRHDYDSNAETAAELKAGLPFLDINVVRQLDFDFLVDMQFATDRDLVPKGIIEVMI